MAEITAKTAALAPWAAWALVIAGVITTWIKSRVPLRQADTEAAKVRIDGDTSLRTDLMARVVALELARDTDRAACDERIERMEERHDTAILKLEAEIQSLRHERNNLRQAFNFLISGAKKSDDPKLAERAIEAEEMLTRGDQATALEKGAMKGSKR